MNEETFDCLFQIIDVDINCFFPSTELDNCSGFAKPIPEDNLKTEPAFEDFFRCEVAAIESIVAEEQIRKQRRTSSASQGSSSQGYQSSSGTETSSKNEAAIKYVFDHYKDYLEGVNPDENSATSWYDYPVDVRGGLIKKKSTPDIACINTHTDTLIVGQLKNSSKYQQSGAVRQCAAYMYHILWWFRVHQGRDVQEVSGFCVCGPKCQQLKGKVAVSFLRLGVPEKIGGLLPLSCYHETHDLDSAEMMKQLGAYLTREHGGTRPNDTQRIVFDGHPVPGSMMLPRSFCGSQPVPGLRVVASGSCALVLNITEPTVENVVDFMQESVATELESEDLKLVLGNFENDKSIYVKLINPAAGSKWADKWMFLQLLRFALEPDYDYGLGAYEEKGFIYDRRFITVIMHDMGSPIGSIKPKDLPKLAPFCLEFLGMMERTEHLWTRSKAVHGDIHRHNVLYKAKLDEGKRLNLIDWDECTSEYPMPRNVTQHRHKERYPESFKRDGLSFTRVQLLVLLRDFVYQNYDNVMSMDANNTTITFVDKESKGDDFQLAFDGRDANDIENCFEALKKGLKAVGQQG